MRIKSLLLLSTFALTGCVSTAYQTPVVPVAAQFAHAEAGEGATAKASDWWTAFGDPKLDALVSAVLEKNNNLAAAGLAVQKAQLTAGLSRLDQLPTVSGGVSGSTSNTTSYSASLGVSYEVDLYGRLGDATRAATWEAKATEEDLAATRLSLAGTTAELYWNIAYTHRQIAIGEENLAYAVKVRDLVVIQHGAGSVSGVEMAEAEQNVSSQQASLSSLQQQLVQYRSALTVLLGGEVWDEASEPQSLPDQALPEVAAGLPADLLARRPDLRAAEMRLRETLATVDATRKSLYPAVTLTASGGGASSELGDVLRNPTGAIAAALSLPFLDYARVRTNVKVSQASYEIAVANFKTILLQALADTDNALSNRTQLSRQAEAQAATLAAAKKAEALYAVRYRSGSVALRVWLDAQQSLRSAQLAYDNIRLSQLVNQSTLYQALGG